MKVPIVILLLVCSSQIIPVAQAQRDQNDLLQDSLLELFLWNKSLPQTGASEETINSLFEPGEGEDSHPLQNISQICPKKVFFYGMNPRHMKAVSMVESVLLEQDSPLDVIEMAGALRDREEINPHTWLRALVSTTLHRPDMHRFKLPSMVEVMPSLFVPTYVLDHFRNSSKATSRFNNNGSCVVVDGTVGEDNGVENRLWYWREDVMVNSHHWYWHLSFPLNSALKPDRGGELFYFMHHEFMARYHTERLAAGLRPVKSFNMRNGSLLPLGYNSHMGDGNSGREWSVRPANVPVSDVNSTLFPGDPDVFVISIETRGIQLRRIYDGISNGSLIGTDGLLIPLNNDEGVSFLSDTAEANIFSVNPDYYGPGIPGGVHNEGHIVIALAQDPRNENGGPPGVMADPGTSMRDPMFFPYHNSIDDIFTRHKNNLQPYQRRRGNWSLLLRGVRVRSIKTQSTDLPPNVLHTFWGTKRFDLSKGLDFNRSSEQGPMWTCMKHLDHQAFEYELEIERRQFATDIENVTVRIFIGPREDSRGKRYTLEQQRLRMFVLDTFTVPLQFGINTIRRNSTETPLTIDFHQSAQELEKEPNNTNPFCGCGWPHHLLLPKGTRRGLHMDLFAIVTDAKEDHVEPVGGSEPEACKSAYIFCGVMGDRYPDRRPMGYPFDKRLYLTERRGGSRRKYLRDLVREVPNSAMTQVKVKHFNKVRNPE